MATIEEQILTILLNSKKGGELPVAVNFEDLDSFIIFSNNNNRIERAQKSITNGLFLLAENNLSDVDDVPTSRTNLDVYSTSEVYTQAQVDALLLALEGSLVPQGNWDADTNTPDITATTETGHYWIVSVAGNTDLGGITDWEVSDWAIKTATGWAKLDNTQKAVSWGEIIGTLSAQTDLQSALDAKSNLVGGNLFTGDQSVEGVIILASITTGASQGSNTLKLYGTTSGSIQVEQASIKSITYPANSNAGVLEFYTANTSNSPTLRTYIDGVGKMTHEGAARFNGDVGINVDGGGRELHVHSTDSIVSYIKLTSSATGITANDGFDIVQNNGTVDLIQRENLPLRISTNATVALTIDNSQVSTFAGKVLFPSQSGVKGSGSGSANSGFITFYESDGTTSQGLIGFNNVLNNDLAFSNQQTSKVLTLKGGGELNYNGEIEGVSFKISSLNTAPSSASDTGTTGEIRYTSDYIYVCTATNTWKRTALTTW